MAFNFGFKNFAITSVFISLAINITFVPMIKYGKRLRKSHAAYYKKVINW